VKLVYLGSPDAAVGPLRALVAAGHDIDLVVSRADTRRGRGTSLSPSPVKAAALELGLAVTSEPDEVLAAGERGAELGIVVAYGRLIKPLLLDRLRFVNIHFSLLPRWRGAAPVERALLAGDEQTGTCLMELEEGLDTGGVYDRREITIGPEETAAELRIRLVDLGTRQLVEGLANGLASPLPQVGEASYARKLTPEEFQLDWSRPASVNHRWVRVGGAWTTFRGRRVKVGAARLGPMSGGPAQGHLEGVLVGCGDGGALELVSVQPEGKAAMPAGAWLNGVRPIASEHFQ
jgi:methionyl-tRNA formyltransferase